MTTASPDEILLQRFLKDGKGAEALAASYFEKAWFAEAIVVFKAAKNLKPQSRLMLAEALITIGDFDEANKILGELDEKTFPRGVFLKGHMALLSGDPKGAVEFLKRLPPEAEALLELGMAYEAAGMADEAIELFIDLRISNGNYFDTLFERANHFFNLKLFGLARNCLIRAEKIMSRNPEVYYRLGICYMDLNLADEAEAAFRNAIRLKPTLESYRELATLYEKSNNIDQALSFANAALSINPSEPYLHAVIAKCLLRKGDGKRALDALKPHLGDFDDPGLEAEVLTTLGRIYDRLGRPKDAFEAFVKANQATKETENFKGLDPKYPFRNTQAWGEILKSGLSIPKSAQKGKVRPKNHVFYMGFPRSGTTLVQTILEGHSKVSAIDEKPVLRAAIRQLEMMEGGYPKAIQTLTEETLELLRDLYFTQAQNFATFDKDTTLLDKMPLSTLHLPLIRVLFPGAKILFSVRHPYASTLSCLMQNFNLNNAMANLTDLKSIIAFYDLVMTFWQTCRDTLEFTPYILTYEKLIQNVEEETRGICTFLGIDFEPTMLDYQTQAKARGVISTPSYSQVVKPIYKDAIDHWKAYQPFYGKEEKTLTRWAKEFGYSVD